MKSLAAATAIAGVLAGLYLCDAFTSEGTWARRHYPEDSEQW